MKKLSTYLFLILFSFQVPSWADDISDFEIEGISIGDSLLDYFSKKEIKDNTEIGYYTNNKYTPVEFFQLSSFKTYDSVGVTPQIWPKQPRTPPPAVFGLPYVDGGFGKGGNRGAPNEYLIVDGTDGTPGLVEFEKFFASYLYNYASQ